MATDSRNRHHEASELHAVGDDLLDATTEFSALGANADLLDQTAQLERKRRERAGSARIKVVAERKPAAADPDPTIAVGTLLGNRYRLEELVHTGGMGRVYRAVDERIRAGSARNVAIKLLRRSFADRADLRDALEREAASLRQLAHPNIVNVFDFDEQAGQFYLVMEWLDGESAQSLLSRANGTPVEKGHAWRIIEGVARALHHAHSRGIVHADVNPANVMIPKDDDVKLIDFGTCRDREADAGETKTTAWATERYASPETLAGEEPAVEDDLFSLACIAYRLLCGRHPFDGLPADEAKRCNAAPAVIESLSEADWRLLSLALSFDRRDRPKSAQPFFRRSTVPETAIDDREKTTKWQSALPLQPRWPWAAALMVVIVAWGLWSIPGDPVDTPAATDALPAVDSDASSAVADVGDGASVTPGRGEALLDQADRALAEGRLVEPAGSSARDLYRQALAFDSANAEASAGLVRVAERLVDRAQAALAAGRPGQAIDALSIARDIDPDNVAAERTAEAIRRLAGERIAQTEDAIAAGDLAQAESLLARASRFPENDPASIAALAERLAGENELVARVDDVDGHIAARRLVTPAGASAFDAVADLRLRYPDDARVQYATERLGAALVTQAITAMNADRFDEAERQLSALRELGIMRVELAATEDALSLARQRAATVAAAETGAVTGGGTAPAEERAAAATTEELLALEPESDSTPASTGSAAEVETDRVLPFSALDMQRYVPPRYPRFALTRNRTGFVDVGFRVLPDGSVEDVRVLRSEPEGLFDSSAVNAVGRWEFAERGDSVESRVRLSFDLEN